MKANITISRNSHDEVVVRIKDQASRVSFVELTLDLESYGFLITGLSNIEGDVKYRGLDSVGKIRVSEPRCAFIREYLPKDALVTYLKEHCQEEGWIIDPYLSSKGSFKMEPVTGVYRISYSVYKYVEVEDDN